MLVNSVVTLQSAIRLSKMKMQVAHCATTDTVCKRNVLQVSTKYKCSKQAISSTIGLLSSSYTLVNCGKLSLYGNEIVCFR